MSLRIAVLQPDIAWAAPERNLARFESHVAACSADLLLLPEMFATGFCLDPARIAGPDDGAVLATLRRWAADYGCALAGSVAGSMPDATFRNRMYFVEPSGRVSYYDKHHLFTPGGEAAAFRAGDCRTVVSYGGMRFLLAVCYDLRFPVWLRCRDDYDAIPCCASWPASRRDAWCTLLRARAIENQCYVAAANRIGRDPAAHYAGDSVLLDFRGRTLAEAGAEECLIRAGFDLSAVSAFRGEFPAWRDADDFEMRIP